MPDITDQKAQAEHLVKLRQRARTDKMYLADLLGYDFQADVHAEMFAHYVPFDNSKPLMFEQTHKRDRLLLWPRGHYKTSSSVVEIVQMLLNFPDARIMVMQANLKKSRSLIREVRSHFDGSNPRSKLDKVFAPWCGTKLGNADGFTTPARERKHLKEPSVSVASPKASKAGYHFDAGFFGDLVDEQNYKNPDLVKQTIDDFNHYTPLIDPGGLRYVDGTRYTFGDLYEWIIRTNDGRWQISLKQACQLLPNGLVDTTKPVLYPQRQIADGRHLGFTAEMLAAIQRDNPETFSAQYLNQPIAGGRELFTDQLLMSGVRPKDPNATIGPALLFVDLAASVSNEADSSVVLCGRQIQGVPTVTDMRHGQWSTLQIAHTILEMALLHRPLKVLIEGSAGSSFFIEYLRMIARDKGIALFVEPIKVSNNKGAKHLRIAAVEGAIKTRRLAFLAGLPGWTELVEQFKQFPKGRHDDLVDTVSLMVQFYSGHISVEPFPAVNLPFFLMTPGVDFSFENRLLNNTDSEALAFIPEAVF